MLGKTEGRRRRRQQRMRWLDGSMDTNEMLGWTLSWLHRLNGHEFEQTPGDSEGQGSLVCCSSWGLKSD